MESSIVLNSSPTIIILNSGREYILQKLFSKIQMPESVKVEVTKQKDRAGTILENLTWVEFVKTKIIPEVAQWNIGAGESELLSFVKETPNTIAVIDDGMARKCAETIDIPYIGTVGIFLKAKKEKLISSMKDELILLKESGLWISKSLEDRILKLANE